MKHDENLDQRMLELVYDLLPEDEAGALRARIAGEPHVAQAYEKAQHQATLLGMAARMEVPKVELQTLATSGKNSRKHPLVGRRIGWLPWAMSIAAGLLITVTAAGYWMNRPNYEQIASRHLRLLVSGPSVLDPSVRNRYAVRTTTVDGRPISTQLEYAVYTADGRELVSDKLASNEEGELTVDVPPAAEGAVPARFELLAVSDGEVERVQTHLPIEQRRYLTQLSLDKPLYQPGETMYYRSLTLGRFGLDVPQEMAIQYEIRDPSEAVVAGSQLQGSTERGVGNGSFAIPGEIAGGRYTLVARSLQDAFPEEKRAFFIRQYRVPRLKKELEFKRDSYAPGDKVVADVSAIRAEGGPAADATLSITATVDGVTVFNSAPKASASGTHQIEFTLPAEIEKGDAQLSIAVDDGGNVETIAKAIPINLGKVEVAFYPEGGDLVADVENRIYFFGRNPLGEPVHVTGSVVDGQGQELAKLETTYKGLGSFKLTPKTGEKYQLKLTSPKVEKQPELPTINAQRSVALAANAEVYGPGKPVSLTLRTTKADQPLVVSAFCRGVQVGTQPVTTKEGTTEVSLPIIDEATGVIRVTVYDYMVQPPTPIAERLVYRRGDRKLQVKVAGHSEGYSPGEPVAMSLIVTNEKGEPTPAVLGVSIVDDSVLKMADDQTPKMPTHFLLTSEVQKPEDLEKADFYLSDDAKAPTALDMLLGTQGWRRFLDQTVKANREKNVEDQQLGRLVALGEMNPPPMTYDNLEDAKAAYEKDVEQYNDERQAKLLLLGRISFWAGTALLAVLVVVLLVRLLDNVRVWAPALAGAAACAVLGFIWINNQPQAPELAAARQFTAYELVPPAQAPQLEGEAISGDGFTQWHDYGLDHFYYKRLDVLTRATRDWRTLNAPVDRWAAPRLGEKADMLYAAPGAQHDFDAFGERARFVRMPFGRAKQLGAGGGARGFAFGDQDEALGGRFRGRRQLEEFAMRGGLQPLADGTTPQQIAATFPVREYAHVHSLGEPGVRSDFAETVYWSPLKIADANGKVDVNFQLSDAITTFRVLVDAHDGKGRIGTGSGEVISRLPFNLEPSIPLEVNAGDRIDLPVALSNDSDGDLPVKLTLTAGDLLSLDGSPDHEVKLAARQRSRVYFPLAVTGQAGSATLEVRGAAGTLVDAKRQTMKVVPPGFPVAESYAGKLVGDQQVTVKLPAEWVPGSLEVTLSAYPSTLADLQKGLDGLLQEPNGCFEQASTSNYPNVLSLQYLEEHKVANPEVTRRAKELLTNGYGKLTAYESPTKGYEWFGGDPGHEALTAYGLMQFRDMAQVYDVKAEMLDRTAKWLLARRDGKGSYQRNPRALDSFGGAPQHITDAYITWALAESGQKDIATEIKHAIELGRKSDDAYVVALAAAGSLAAGETTDGKLLLDKLAKAQAEDGHLDGKEGSITRSGGESLTIETTALAALAWLKSPGYEKQVQKAVDWIVKHRSGNGAFGSTQSTILALKALIAHAKANRATVAGGDLVVKRGTQEIARQSFGPGHENAISVAGLSAKLEPGENDLTITLTGENAMPYSLDVSYRTLVPLSHESCPVSVSTKLQSSSVDAGGLVHMDAQLSNKTDKGQPMTLAIIGLTAGLQAQAKQLEQLRKAGTVDYYETRAREVIFYWRSLAPSKKVDIGLDLVAQWPGHYTGPASRAYLYYTPEQKNWTQPLIVDISQK